jgi:hypothetical protein
MPTRVIDVPKTDPGAYNPGRAAGALLQAQAAHMREALRKRLQEFTTLVEVDLTSLKTEADVSAYIHKATALLHTYHGRPKDE